MNTRVRTLVHLLFASMIGSGAGCSGGGVPSSDHGDGRPACVMIIRHGEKTADSKSLSHEGKKRADELIDLFNPDRTTPLPRPDYLFAARDSKNSDRPVETLEPLSKTLGLTVDHKFTDKDSKQLAEKLFKFRDYRDKTILICWHHSEIPDLARALQATDAPAHWKGDVYDRVWKITYSADKVQFSDLPQNLPVDRREDRDKHKDKGRGKSDDR